MDLISYADTREPYYPPEFTYHRAIEEIPDPGVRTDFKLVYGWLHLVDDLVDDNRGEVALPSEPDPAVQAVLDKYSVLSQDISDYLEIQDSIARRTREDRLRFDTLEELVNYCEKIFVPVVNISSSVLLRDAPELSEEFYHLMMAMQMVNLCIDRVRDEANKQYWIPKDSKVDQLLEYGDAELRKVGDLLTLPNCAPFFKYLTKIYSKFR